MIRKLLGRFFIATFLFGIIALPCELSLAAGAKNAADIITVRPALWRVEKGESRIYLLGSFHLLPTNYRWYDGIIRRSFEGSDGLVLETDINPKGMAEIQGMIAKNAFFGPQDSLKNHLDDSHYRKLLEKSAALLKANEMSVNRMKPWVMALQLSVAAIVGSGMDPNSGVDKYLQTLAKRAGKPVSGLETPRDQMMALIDHPLSVQVAMLNDTLDKLDDFKSYINSYLAAWASGNPDRMVKTMVDDMAENPAMYQALLVSRNKNWLPGIEQRLKGRKTTFIVVGAAHLVGPDGIIKMLTDKGYKVAKIQ